ncbi:family 43 glycosylhydrolase [Echinicola shivajiensis]|uniref:family 43 glycosylhydrolase n=1 Tax=Echinicola shivajiensis TaxID=1035916 RepID=UPI001BFC806A|nr:family 43 glycosylhydrolase [Echinicola shivajiensis]
MKLPLQSIFIFLLSVGLAACSSNAQEAIPDTEDSEKEVVEGKYTNPVFEPVLADPTIVSDGDYFYAYGTEDNWGNEGGYHLVPVIKSKDLIQWELVGDALKAKPTWKSEGGIWAPDVSKVGDNFYMYYSYSTWGDANPGIGLAIADSPEGPFEDYGKIFDSNSIGVNNSIDPFYYEEDGQKYLLWGSFRGLYMIKLSEDGKSTVGEKVQVAGDHLEASYVYKKDNFYYLFGSYGSCCEGANSSYQVWVGRSEKLEGPYLDKSGNKLLDGHYGELVVKGNLGSTGFAGPGHNAEIVTDAEGEDWLVYHGMLKSKPRTNNGTNRRSLLIDKIIWTDGWPSLFRQEPSTKANDGPQF